MIRPVEFFDSSEIDVWSRFGKIHVSTAARERLSFHELTAVVLHERGHIDRWHTPIKMAFDVFMLLVPVAGAIAYTSPGWAVAYVGIVPLWLWLSRLINHWTEYDADLYAVKAGVGKDLAVALAKLDPEIQRETWSHPAALDRIVRIHAKAQD